MLSFETSTSVLNHHRDLIDQVAAKRAARTSLAPSSAHARSPSPEHPDAKAAKTRYLTYVPEEETIRNDLPSRYAVAGDRSTNYIASSEEEDRFIEYPRLHRLLSLKKQQVEQYSHPPLLLQLPVSAPLKEIASSLVNSLGLNNRFDSILITPPPNVDWTVLSALPIRSLAADVSFCFLWCGPENALEKAKDCLVKWGFRRAEEVAWLKTNVNMNAGPGTEPPTSTIFANTKEHLLVGIRGQLRRATDGWFVHSNCDTDVIVWEGNPKDSHQRPPEAYSLVENLCLGNRRLDLFGRQPRRGWVTVRSLPIETTAEAVGQSDCWSSFDPETYESLTLVAGKHVVPCTPDIENLRPKSPSSRGRPRSTPSASSSQSLQYSSSHPRTQNPVHQPYVQYHQNQFSNQSNGMGITGEARMVQQHGMGPINGLIPATMGSGSYDPMQMQQNQYMALQQQYALQQQQELLLYQQQQLMGFPPGFGYGYNGYPS